MTERSLDAAPTDAGDGTPRASTRRDVLRLGVVGAVTAAVAACSDAGDGDPATGNDASSSLGGRGTKPPPAAGTAGASGTAGAGATALPEFDALTSIAKLPDPFKLLNGARIATKAEWSTRRAELKALAEKYVYGVKPPKPGSMTASASGNKLNITCSEGGKSITFSATVYKPSGASGPAPAIIGLCGSSLGGVPSGIGSIYFDNNALGQQANASSRNKGLFFDLYGTAVAGTSACMAWAWGLSRIIDALEQVDMGINPQRLGVTGCSRNGKGALVCGVWDERIALVIPEESGSGGVNCWRVAEEENKEQSAYGGVQTASQIVGENVWLATAFEQFAKSGNMNKLPLDQHAVIAIRAPLPILIIENSSQYWLGPKSCYAGGSGAYEVYKALGAADRFGFSQYGDGGHCAFQTQNSGPHVTAFCKRFLLDDASVETASIGVQSDGKNSAAQGLDGWLDWSAPVLT